MSKQSRIEDLTVDKLLSSASARTNGLSHFGDDNYRASLQALLDALVAEAALSPSGVQLLEERLIGQLVNRLVMEDYLARYPEIAQIRIDDPLVIVGLPRTGTTMLQRTLAVDPRFYSAAWWETRLPAPLADETLSQPTQRIAQAKAEVGQPSHSDPPLADTSPRSASKVFPFQFSPTPSRPLKSTRGEKPLDLSSPLHKKMKNPYASPTFFT